MLSGQPSDRFGHPLAQSLQVIQSCSRALANGGRILDPACLTRRGAGYNHAAYQPASCFWLFQGIETGLFAGTAVVLILFAAWWVHERTA